MNRFSIFLLAFLFTSLCANAETNEFSDRNILMSCDYQYKVVSVKNENLTKKGKGNFPFYVGSSYVEVDGDRYKIIKNSHSALEFQSDDIRPKMFGRFNLALKTGTLEQKIDFSDYIIGGKKEVRKEYTSIKISTYKCK